MPAVLGFIEHRRRGRDDPWTLEAFALGTLLVVVDGDGVGRWLWLLLQGHGGLAADEEPVLDAVYFVFDWCLEGDG